MKHLPDMHHSSRDGDSQRVFSLPNTVAFKRGLCPTSRLTPAPPALGQASHVKNPWRTLLERRFRPQLCITVLMPFFQQFTGINAVRYPSPIRAVFSPPCRTRKRLCMFMHQLLLRQRLSHIFSENLSEVALGADEKMAWHSTRRRGSVRLVERVWSSAAHTRLASALDPRAAPRRSSSTARSCSAPWARPKQRPCSAPSSLAPSTCCRRSSPSLASIASAAASFSCKPACRCATLVCDLDHACRPSNVSRTRTSHIRQSVGTLTCGSKCLSVTV